MKEDGSHGEREDTEMNENAIGTIVVDGAVELLRDELLGSLVEELGGLVDVGERGLLGRGLLTAEEVDVFVCGIEQVSAHSCVLGFIHLDQRGLGAGRLSTRQSSTNSTGQGVRRWACNRCTVAAISTA